MDGQHGPPGPPGPQRTVNSGQVDGVTSSPALPDLVFLGLLATSPALPDLVFLRLLATSELGGQIV